MLISLIIQIAQSMQISTRHFLVPQTTYIPFPLKKNLAVKNISGLVCLASGLYQEITRTMNTIVLENGKML